MDVLQFTPRVIDVLPSTHDPKIMIGNSSSDDAEELIHFSAKLPLVSYQRPLKRRRPRELLWTETSIENLMLRPAAMISRREEMIELTATEIHEK